MKQTLSIGMGLLAVIAIVAVVAFNAVGSSSNEPSLAANDMATEATNAQTLVQPVVQEIVEPNAVPVDSPLVEQEADSEIEVVSSSSDRPDDGVEGIKVHGTWTLDVIEPDGKLVSHHEFENALSFAGTQSLPMFLARTNTVGRWNITLDGSPRPCFNNSGTARSCQIFELSASSSAVTGLAEAFGELSATAPAIGPNAGSLVLAGTATMATDTSVSIVSTSVRRCDSSIAPDDVASSCGGVYQIFTQRSLGASDAVPVLAGQTVNVTVVISFS